MWISAFRKKTRRVFPIPWLGEAPLAEEVGAVVVTTRDDPLARRTDVFDKGLLRGGGEADQSRRRLMREAIGGVGMLAADCLKVLDAPDIAVLAGGAQIEAG